MIKNLLYHLLPKALKAKVNFNECIYYNTIKSIEQDLACLSKESSSKKYITVSQEKAYNHYIKLRPYLKF